MSEEPTRVVPTPSDVDAIEARPAPRNPPPHRLGRGDEVGRYVVLDLVGAGGMGEVYAAYDPELDRKVALKLLLRRGSPKDSTEGEARLLREAQSMAKLTHPNVVAVYDAGTLDDQVFITMEFVEGTTLRDWLADTEEGWRGRLGPFLAAGRGLAAAHEVGLVHRDFKPSNVMIQPGGGVRVLDFGLARQLGGTAEVPIEIESLDISTSGSRHTVDPLTRTGLVTGTPAYMAPEQFRNDVVDARTDQFAYCIALYEALYFERPFGQDPYAKLAVVVQQGHVRPAPAGTRVPQRVRKILLRGLHVDPEARFASMDELLTALRRAVTPWHRRPITWAAAATVATVTITASAVAVAPAAEDPCPDPTPRLAEVWDAERSDRVETAFTQTGLVYAQDAADRSTAALDNYATRWVRAHRDACEATHVRREQSEALLDRRMACLGERLAELDAIGSLFEESDAKTVEKAVSTAMGLGGLEACADVAKLTDAVAPPQDPAMRREVEHVRGELARHRVLLRGGMLAQAREHSASLLERAKATQYEPLIGETLVAFGASQAATGNAEEGAQKIRDALMIAERLGHVELEFTSRAALISIVGWRLARHEEAHRHAAFARALEPRIRLQQHNLGVIELSEGLTYNSEGKPEQALQALDAALKIRRGGLEPDHPEIARILVNKGSVLVAFERYDEAEAAFTEALEIFKRSIGEVHPQIATSLHNLGLLRLTVGDFEGARSLVSQAVQIWDRVLPRDHSDQGLAQQSLGIIELRTGHPDKALVHYRRAVEIKTKSLGPAHPSVALGRGNMADALNKLGRHDEALREAEAARAVAEQTVGTEHPMLAPILSNIGEAQFGLGQFDEAEASLKSALQRFETTPSDPVDDGRLRMLLARIHQGRGESEPARALAGEAVELFRPRGEAAVAELEAAESFLGELPPASNRG